MLRDREISFQLEFLLDFSPFGEQHMHIVVFLLHLFIRLFELDQFLLLQVEIHLASPPLLFHLNLASFKALLDSHKR